MRAFVELCAKGGRRLIVEAADIRGILTSENKGATDMGTPEKPVTLIIRNCVPVDIIGMEPAMIFATICEVMDKADRVKDMEGAPPIVVQWLERDDGKGA